MRKPILRTREALAMCDIRRAKRTDPTPQQTETARRDWHVPKLSRWLAQRTRGAV